MRKRIFFLFALLFLILSTPASGVLNEKNLGQTLAVLREELEMYQHDSRRNQMMGQVVRERVHRRLMDIMNESNQIALMLYSQKIDYIFDLTYACNKATDLYDDFNTMRLPFDKVLTKMEVEEARYNGLIDNLTHMPKEILNQQERTDREVCLTLCVAMKRSLQNQSEELKEYREIYQKVSERLKKLNDYAIKRYNNIRQSIFVNGDETYFGVLSNMSTSIMKAQYSMHEKYSASKAKRLVFFRKLCYTIFVHPREANAWIIWNAGRTRSCWRRADCAGRSRSESS